MSYVEDNLIKDEKIVHSGKISKWAMLPMFLLGLITLPIVIGVYFILKVLIYFYTTELVITNKRVISKSGLISRDTMEMNISKVESIQVDQSILGRIFNHGSILIAGAGDPKTPVIGIAEPLEFRKKFFEVQEELESASKE